VNGDDLQKEIFRKMTGGQKLRLAMRLYWSARRLKAGWLRQQHPDWSEERVEAEVTQVFKNVRPCLHNGLPAVMPTDSASLSVDTLLGPD